MFSNPIIRRYRFSQFRPQQAWVFGSLYVCIALLILFINTSIYRYSADGYDTVKELYVGLFVQFAVLELFLLWLLCPANCSNVVGREIADKSFDFFRMLPLSASQKAIGILAGRNLFCLMLAAVNLGICVGFALAGELSPALVRQMLTTVLALTFALNLLALLFSVITYKKNKVTSIPVLLVIGLFAFGPVIGFLVGAVNDQKLEAMTAYFFTVRMPLLYLISCCAMFVGVWAYLGIVRRFTREYEALFSRVGAAVFLLSVMVVLCGLFYKFFFHYDALDAGRAFWLVSLLPVAVVPLFAMRSFDKYLEITRTAHRVKGLWGRLLAHSNVVSGLILYAIWLGFAVSVGVTVQAAVAEMLWLVILSFSAYLVILALLETYVMWQPKNEKIGYLVGFAGILYFVLPLILAAMFENEALTLFSPFGIIGIFEEDYPVMTLLMPAILNLVWLLPLCLLIGKRYDDLVGIRTGMQKPQAEVSAA